ncbi:MAG: hypothetical protein Q8L04_10550 [Ignavibacteria bacterium]|nr:hypothetical protein [Ignavibacteria bacterium]
MNDLISISNVVLIVVIIGLGLFIKKYLPSYFNEKGKNLATKEDIADITNRIESVKSTYEKTLVKFSTFHKNQADVIANLYKHLVTALDDAFQLTTPNDERLKRANKSSSEFISYYKLHRIYLEPHIKEQIESILIIMGESYIDFETSRIEGLERREKSEYLKSAYNKINKEALPILEELENKFRELLSV